VGEGGVHNVGFVLLASYIDCLIKMGMHGNDGVPHDLYVSIWQEEIGYTKVRRHIIICLRNFEATRYYVSGSKPDVARNSSCLHNYKAHKFNVSGSKPDVTCRIKLLPTGTYLH
jgi:hypothetical protein